jgi:hypothetical protein
MCVVFQCKYHISVDNGLHHNDKLSYMYLQFIIRLALLWQSRSGGEKVTLLAMVFAPKSRKIVMKVKIC